MLFHEIYSCYYNAVAEILKEAVRGELTPENMREIIQDKAFGESFITIIPALENQKWKLLDRNFKTPFRHEPTMPLTTLQKRWLKAVSLDSRIQLFGVNMDFPENVEPLFTREDYVVFDRYHDGDEFEDENYIYNFQTILQAIRGKKRVEIEYVSRKGVHKILQCDPYRLEYSEKDDKFRVFVSSCRFGNQLNMGCVKQCKVIGEAYPMEASEKKAEKRYFVMELTDERNTLERVMLHFAHFEKCAERVSDNQYRVTIYYEGDDETEILIRVLSFGPFVKVAEPKRAVELIRKRLNMQKSCGLK